MFKDMNLKYCMAQKACLQISDILGFLLTNNFKLDGVYNMSYDKNGDPVQADFLFLNCSYE